MTMRSAVNGRRSALIPRELAISLALFLVLIVVTVLRPQPKPTGRAYDPNSAAPDGLLALRLWLEELGYTVGMLEGAEFALPSDADLLFVYPGVQRYSRSEAMALQHWVGTGHTLVLIDTRLGDAELTQTLGVEPTLGMPVIGNAPHQRQPLLPEAPEALDWCQSGAGLRVTTAGEAIVALGGYGEEVTAIVQAWDAGLIWHLSRCHALVNTDLQERGQGVLLPAILRGIPPRGKVYFDTFHLFGPTEAASVAGPEQVRTLQDWLWRTPPGLALLFAVAAILVYLLLAGRRLGPPLPAVTGMRRREAAEFVQAMAGLHRRARHGAMAAQYHRRRLKVGLGRANQIAADLPDAEFLARLAEADGHLTPDRLAALRRLLDGLAGEPNEEQLVRLVAGVDEILT